MQEEVARCYEFARFRVDTARRVLLHDGRPVTLTARVFDLLVFLLCRRDRVVSRVELLNAFWPDVAVEDGNLSVHISTLRKALQRAGGNTYIETLPRVGYRFCADVVEHARGQASGELAREAPKDSERADAPLRPASSEGQTLFVGRQPELERMAGVAHRVLRGERRSIVLTGEAGLGKTALVNAFVERLQRGRELWIARGQCVEQYGSTEPYRPILESMGRLCRAAGGPRLVEVVRRAAPTWLSQIPSLLDPSEAAASSASLRGATPERMVREFADVVELLASERPVVLCLEDLHWADYSTLDLIAYLAQLPPARCLLIGTYRPAEDGSVAEMLGKLHDTLRSRGLCTDLVLEHLGPAAVAEYLTARFGAASAAPGLASALHERTRGNPLFVVQMADALSEQGLTQAREGTPQPDAGEPLRRILPESTVQHIEAEVDRLPVFARTLLEAASVAGVEFAVAAVAEATGQDVVQVERLCLSWARKRRLLSASEEREWPDGTRTATFRFIHALYQQVLYRRLGVAQRSLLHQRLGECLERVFAARASEIASQLHPHFERGLEPRRAVTYLYQGGKTALARGAYREAVELFQRGLRLLRPAEGDPADARRELELQVALGAALTLSRGYGSPEVEQVYTRARVLSEQLDDTPARLNVLRGICFFFLARGRLLVAHELAIQFASLAAGGEDAQINAGTMLAMCTFSLGRPSEALEHAQRSVALGDGWAQTAISTPRGQGLRVRSLANASLVLWVCGYPDRALEHARRALALAEGAKGSTSLAYPRFFVGLIHAWRGELSDAREHAEALRRLAEQEGLPHFLALALLLRGHALVGLGQVEDGIRCFGDGWAWYAATGAELMGSFWLCAYARALLQAGRVERACAQLNQAFALAGRNHEEFWMPELWSLQGELSLECARRGVPESLPDPGGRRAPEDCFLQALERSRADGARSLELRAALSLTSLWRDDRGQRLVREVYTGFGEGHATADLVTARQLLDGSRQDHAGTGAIPGIELR
jgi:DNA-binding winged helix-turn-helix (wHTH) protein/tetratricopeptide (TPR) repeat protein